MNIRDVISSGDFEDAEPGCTGSASNDQRQATVGDPYGDSKKSTDMIYSYLRECTIRDMRKLNKEWRMKVSGSKQNLIGRSMIKVLLLAQSGKTYSDILAANNACQSTEKIYERAGKYPELIYRTPPMEELFSYLPPEEAAEVRQKWDTKRHGRDGGNGLFSQDDSSSTMNIMNETIDCGEIQTSQNNSFTLSECARLIIILRDDEQARAAAVTDTEDTLSRIELDQGIKRDSFWTIVARSFNNACITEKACFSGFIDGVDPSAKPLVHRTGEKLKEVFKAIRSALTEPKLRWQQSGQNNPENFQNFLPRLRSGELTASGKRVYIMFCAARFGTPAQDDSFIRLASRTIDNSGVDTVGFDEGFTEEDGVEHLSSAGKSRSTNTLSATGIMFKKCGLQVETEAEEQFSATCAQISKLAQVKMDAIKSFLGSSGVNGRNANACGTVQSAHEHEIDNGVANCTAQQEKIDKAMDLLSKASNTLESAKAINNAVIVSAAKKHFEKVQEQCIRIFSESNRNVE